MYEVIEVVAIWEKLVQPDPVHLSMEYWLIEPPFSAEAFQVRILKGVGHGFHLERPEETVREVLEHLADAERA